MRRVQERQHAIGFESLADEIAIQPVELAVVGDVVAGAGAWPAPRPSSASASRSAKTSSTARRRRRRGDAGAFDLPLHAQLAALAERRLAPRNGLGDADVVDGSLLAAVARWRRRWRRRRVLRRASRWRICASESSRRPSSFERVDVGSADVAIAPKRVTSGLPVTVCAIWSRLMSAVVEMPWTLSLNSSTLLAQRSASS